MVAKLVILGLLRDGPMHGYEIKRRIEHEEMAEWAGISYGAIYFALNELTKEGFVEQIGTQRVGRRPSRKIYRITERGREEFLVLLRQTLSMVENRIDPLDVGLRFMDALPRQELRSLLGLRKEKLKNIFALLAQERDQLVAQHREEPFLETICTIVDHGLAQLQAEIRWLTGVLDKLEKGLLP